LIFKEVSLKRELRFIFIFFLAFIIILLNSDRSFSKEFPDCTKCHKIQTRGKTVHPALNQGCVSCHTQPHEKEAKSQKFLFATGAELCWGCHDRSKFEGRHNHPPVAGGMCTSCHDVHVSDNPKLLLSPAPDLCYNCHDKGMFTKKSIHPPVAGGMCTSCHFPHKSDADKLLQAKTPDLCFNCHNRNEFTGKKNIHPPVNVDMGAGTCSNCHDPHSAGGEKLLLLPLPEICYKCHNKDRFVNKYIHTAVAGGMCTGCHLPHQSDTPELLMAESPQLCYQCHERKDTKKNVHPPVAAGMCSSCHNPHASANEFQLPKPINSSCTMCHPQIGKAPHVVSGFKTAGHPLAGEKDPKRAGKKFTCTSCHDPHDSDFMKLFRYPSQTAFGICTHCHNY
jgi:predicted CXXCH cytochrome family protein